MKISRRLFVAHASTAAASTALFHGRFRAWGQNGADRVRLAGDPERPQYHLLPAANWMNDPNGPIYWKGEYHVFFQYNPHAAVWGDMHWAHAASADMVHWRHLPLALAPTPGGPDAQGCFSGSAVVAGGVPTFLYTGVANASPADATLRDGTHNFRETQCLATSRDPMLRTWTKLSQPVIATPPPGMKVTGFRDPCLWREGDTWYLALGSGVAKQGGMVLLYRSGDLRAWEYLHPLLTGTSNEKSTRDPVDSGDMWECPDFFALGGKHVLLYSTERKVYWTVGELDAKELTFHPQRRGLLDSGSYYAPKSMLDKDGNRILWGWIQETRPEAEYSAAGWAGCMSLPRVLTIGPSGDLEMRVAPALQALRGRALTASRANDLSFANYAAEIVVSFARSEQEFKLWLLPDVEANPIPHISVRYEPENQGIRLDETLIALPQPRRPIIDLRLFMDGSVVEVFVDNRLAHIARIYGLKPNRVTKLQLEGKATSLAVWPMKPISPDRLTS